MAGWSDHVRSRGGSLDSPGRWCCMPSWKVRPLQKKISRKGSGNRVNRVCSRPDSRGVIALVRFRRWMMTAGGFCTFSVRARSPEAFCGSIVWNQNLLALVFSIVMAIIVVQYALNSTNFKLGHAVIAPMW